MKTDYGRRHGNRDLRSLVSLGRLRSAVRFLFPAFRSLWSLVLPVIALLAALPGPALAQSDKIPGMSLGSFKIGNTGGASYSIPIITPPGTNGLQPRLGLSFDSQSGNGLLGMGMSLTGLSAIHRCPRTVAQDGAKGGLNFDANDRYCLDGTRLIALVDGTDGQNNAEYRTEIDTFVRVFSYGTAGNGPAYWIIKNKNGETMEFGNTADSRIEAQGKTSVRVWALNKITDASQNYLTVTYTEDSTNGDYRPLRIDYTGNEGQGFATQRKVEFSYSSRTQNEPYHSDITPLYVGGSLVKTTQRLSRIKTYAPPPQGGAAVLVRDYRLAYEYGTATERLRLKTITECDANNACLPATTFTWQEGGNGTLDPHSISIPTGFLDTAARMADVNGDGRSDFVSAGGGNLTTFFSNGDGTYNPVVKPEFSGWSNAKLWTGDFDGNGKGDFVSGSVNGKVTTFFSNGDGTYQPVPINTPTGFVDTNVRVADVDGDGRSDLVSIGGGSVTTFISNGDGTYNRVAIPESGWSASKLWTGDFDGDGKGDFFTGSTNNQITTFFSNGDGTYRPVVLTTPTDFSDTKLWVGDFNSDGKSDLLTVKNGKLTTMLSKGDGTFDIRQISPLPSGFADTAVWIADVNGDGRADIISSGGGNVTIFYSKGDGNYWSAAIPDTNWSNLKAWIGEPSGDGKGDAASAKNGQLTTFIANGPFPDLLTSITTNLGGKIDIFYKPITDSTVYTKDNDAKYPIMDLQIPMYVVDSHIASPESGTGQTYEFTYDYGGAKFHHLGRGGLGFRWTRIVDETTQARVENAFKQVKVDPVTQAQSPDFPFIGMLANSTTFDNTTGAIFAQVTNEYDDLATQDTQVKVRFTAVKRTVKDQCDGEPLCLNTAVSFEYDTQGPGGKTFGNVKRTLYEGDTSFSGDEREELTDWAIDPTTGIQRPSHTTLSGFDLSTNTATLMRERWLTHDSSGRLISEESRLTGGQGDPGNPVVTHGYDGFGNRTSTTGPLGCTTITTIDTLTKTFPATVTNCLGHTTTFTWDPRFGAKLTETDPNHTTGDPIITTYTFDTFGRLTKVVGPLDSPSFPATTIEYLNWGNAATQRIKTSRRKDYGQAAVIVREDWFDGLGRTDLIKSTGPNDPVTGLARMIVEDSVYDSRGLVVSKTPPRFEGETVLPSWEYTHDVLGRQVRVDHPDFRFATVQYKPGEVIITDENGHQKRKLFDAYGQVDEIWEINGSETNKTFYVYDDAGSLIRVTNHLGHNTSIKYDPLGRKIAMCDPNMGADPSLTSCDTSTPGAWVYVYDKAGNLLNQTDAKNQTLTFDYDALNRVKDKFYAGGAGTITYTYDDPLVQFSKGRLTRVDDLNAMVTTFLYDKIGRVTQTQRVIDGPTYTMSQTYNALSKVTTETFPDLESASYTYNEAGGVKAITDGGTNYVNQIDYNARGQKTKIQYANGVTTNFTFFDQDDPNNPSDFINFLPKSRVTGGGSLQDLEYTHDNVGNILAVVDHMTNGTAGRTFGYDDLNRLTSAIGKFGPAPQGSTVPTDASQAYSYDAIGNILTKGGVQYFYEDANHPSFVSRTFDQATSTTKLYTADINGNTLTGAGRTFAWTADNRVESVTMGSTTTMDYDYTGARMKKWGPLGLTVYPFAGYEIGPDGTKTKYFKVGNETLASKQTPTANPEKKLFYHNDHLGGVNVITDITGAKVQLNEYDPWGKVSRTEGNVDPEKRFTGQILDPESGLYYYGARYYDPELARFISPDPIVPSPGDPQTLNRYSYARNNPVKYIDPSGMSFWSAIANFFKGFFRSVPALVTGIAVGWATWGAGPILAGILGGVTAAVVNTAINGGNWGQAIGMGAVLGGIIGGIGGDVFKGFGGVADKGFNWANFVAGVKTGAAFGAVIGGISTAIHGGNVLQNVAMGALSGAVSSAAAFGIMKGATEAWNSFQQWLDDPKVEIGSRPVAGSDFEHKFIRFPGGGPLGGRIVEAGPDAAGNYTVYDTAASPGTPGVEPNALPDTARHILRYPEAINWTETDISMSRFNTALKTWMADFVGKPFNIENSFFLNSNHFVNYVISNAGGNPSIPGAFAPACTPQGCTYR